MFLLQLGLQYLSSMGQSNIWLANFSTIIITSLFLGFYARILFRLKIKARLLLFILAVITLTSFISISGWLKIDKMFFLTSDLLISLLSVLVLFQTLKENVFLLKKSVFWIAVASFFHYTITTLIFSALDLGLVNNSKELTQIYITFHPIVNITTNLLYTVAFLCQWKPKTLPSS